MRLKRSHYFRGEGRGPAATLNDQGLSLRWIFRRGRYVGVALWFKPRISIRTISSGR